MKNIIFILLCAIYFQNYAQSETLTLQEAVSVALKNNAAVRADAYEIQASRQLRKTSFDLPKTNISLLYGQYNGYPTNDNNLTVSQNIPFTALGSIANMNRSLLASSEMKKAVTENELTLHVKQVYYEIAYSKSRRLLLLQEDSILSEFLKFAIIRNQAGEASILEKVTAETQRNEVHNRLLENETTTRILRSQLKTLLNSNTLPDIHDSTLQAFQLPEIADATSILDNPSLAYARQQVEIARKARKVAAASAAPDILLGYFNQTLIGVVDTESGLTANRGDRFSGLQIGLSIPLWFVPQQGRTKAAELGWRAADSKYKDSEFRLQGELQQATERHIQYLRSLEYYQTSALPNTNVILRQYQLALQSGDIGFAEYLMGLRSTLAIKERHLQTLSEYNQNAIYIQYLSGN